MWLLMAIPFSLIVWLSWRLILGMTQSPKRFRVGEFQWLPEWFTDQHPEFRNSRVTTLAVVILISVILLLVLFD